VIRLARQGVGTGEIATQVHLSETTVRAIRRKLRRSGLSAARDHGTRRPDARRWAGRPAVDSTGAGP
jgi:hypothetical protein